MGALLVKIWRAIKSVLWLLLPGTFGKMQRSVRSKPDEIVGGVVTGKEAGGWSRGLLWVLHILLVIAVLVGLYYLGWKTRLWGLVRGNPNYIPFYLPSLALSLYLLLWLGWYLVKLIGTEDEESRYPDIDAAWEEAMRALDQAGIDVKSAPLFLVLGKPAGTEEALFDASGQRLNVRRVPPRAASPLQVYAGPEAIFVTCAGASLLGELADIVAGVKEPVMGGELDGQPSMMLGGGTRLPNANFIKMQKILRGAGGRKLNEEEHRELAKL